MGSCLWVVGCVYGTLLRHRRLCQGQYSVSLSGRFAQFAVYATAGELLSGRMLEGTWQINRATWFKSLSWGIGGVLVTLAFTVFSQGTRQAMAAGLLPGYGNALAQAFFTSVTNNLFFAPIHSALMRVCGNYAEIRFWRGSISLHAKRWTL